MPSDGVCTEHKNREPEEPFMHPDAFDVFIRAEAWGEAGRPRRVDRRDGRTAARHRSGGRGAGPGFANSRTANCSSPATRLTPSASLANTGCPVSRRTAGKNSPTGANGVGWWRRRRLRRLVRSRQYKVFASRGVRAYSLPTAYSPRRRRPTAYLTQGVKRAR